MLKITLVSTTEDYEKCVAIRRRVFVEEQGVAAELEIDTYENQSSHFLVEWNGKPVGTGRFRVKDTCLKFERIATLKEMRGKGIGSALMNFMQSKAERDFPSLVPYMHAQDSARSFYEKLGWQVKGDPFEEAGIKHVAMVLSSSRES